MITVTFQILPVFTSNCIQPGNIISNHLLVLVLALLHLSIEQITFSHKLEVTCLAKSISN